MHPWPLYELEIKTEKCVLRLPSDQELFDHVDGFHSDVFAFGEAGFLNGDWWKKQKGLEFNTQFLRYQWLLRANWQNKNWSMPLGIFVDDKLVGMQSLRNNGVEKRIMWGDKAAYTGSWLLKDYHGKGIGKAARAGIARLAFDIGFKWVISTAIPANEASIGVSKSLGYTAYKEREIDGKNHVYLALAEKRFKYDSSIEITGLDEAKVLF